jgi:aerobic-type carbon monoxide dehydrogenase small subunit (CoxS/CutS family)
MGTEKPTIIFNIVYAGEIFGIQTYRNQYPSLMTLIADHLGPPGFGLCCGMGSCGTCIVQISNSGSVIKRTVLACAIQINDELANTNVTIPEGRY